MKNTRGSEWNKWDLHIHTASSYDSPYKADDADELLCQALPMLVKNYLIITII